uniref:CCHC-type domain-containing protein n=1 Tax=Anopheles coluzzii TaxID=1518534 RepID=A0A8W7PKP8_ANOCL
MFGRTLKASIAKDNGKSAQHAQRKQYPDKSRCYECGTEGHMSYSCPKNVLGNKTPPRKKDRKQAKRKQPNETTASFDWASDTEEGLAASLEPTTAGCTKKQKVHYDRHEKDKTKRFHQTWGCVELTVPLLKYRELAGLVAALVSLGLSSTTSATSSSTTAAAATTATRLHTALIATAAV